MLHAQDEKMAIVPISEREVDHLDTWIELEGLMGRADSAGVAT
jgi:hypothetical protein